MEMCSKCYREFCNRREREESKNSIVLEEATVETMKEKLEVAPKVESVVENLTESVVEDVIVEPAKPVQKNRSRCFECSKKVGLLGFECRCGYVFCSGHRHAGDGHVCTFDHVAFDRKRLADTMEVVAASKLEKL